jgi:hypothetical protein
MNHTLKKLLEVGVHLSQAESHARHCKNPNAMRAIGVLHALSAFIRR